MSKIPMIHYWMGRPVTELSREELLEVVDHMARELATHRTPSAIHANALGRAEMLRRGERYE